ncbi:hypothetical protein [Pedobacter sp. ASV28]|uniref:hypothetical protein n=1 Tax=Pedobacter sp. ASV28 TaxID=2795123 RepID=UPI0018EB0650|nr:hypothetical protein [Pedobacter sp. ASV28]
MKKTLTLLLLSIALVANSYGHALWIETSTKGQKGVSQKVKIFFGEYASKETDSTAKWFSNLKDFKLLLTGPNGNTQELSPTANVLYYEATFTPKEEGHYTLSIVHHVKDLYENAKIDYYALANVFVGKATINNALRNDLALSIQPSKPVFGISQDNPHLVKLNHTPFKNKKITVVGPDQKSETQETNARGVLNFIPKQKGIYFLEAFYEEEKKGTYEGKNYEKVWHVVTYTNEII